MPDAQTLIAVALQSAFRGWKGRQRAQLLKWFRYEKAAFVIQRAFREHNEWKEIITYTNLRRLQNAYEIKTKIRDDRSLITAETEYDNHKLGMDKSDVYVPQQLTQPASASFKKCLRNKATFDEKMSVWRALLELRRGHPSMSTHVCLKALLEASGDLSRAMVLMGDQTYHLKNEGNVPAHLRLLFMPYLKESDYVPKSPKSSKSPRKTTKNLGTGIDGIRTLKTMRAQGKVYEDPLISPMTKMPEASETVTPGKVSFASSAKFGVESQVEGKLEEEEEEESDGLNLTEVIAWSYFSKYFPGNIMGLQAPCQRPAAVTVIPDCKPLCSAPNVLTPGIYSRQDSFFGNDVGFEAQTMRNSITGRRTSSIRRRIGKKSSRMSRRNRLSERDQAHEEQKQADKALLRDLMEIDREMQSLDLE